MTVRQDKRGSFRQSLIVGGMLLFGGVFATLKKMRPAPRDPIKPPVLGWELTAFEWLIDHFGGPTAFAQRPLVLPTPEFFPALHGDAEAQATQLFQRVRELAGMADWPCRLEVFDEDDDLLRQAAPILAAPTTGTGAAGTFQVTSEREILIRYRRAQLRDPVALVATFAHELGHYRLAVAGGQPPGGQDMHECLTDLTAVFMGFGVFQCNAAFRFVQWQDGQYHGWRTASHGYMTQDSLALALALWCAIRGIDCRNALPHLDTNPRHDVKAYAKALATFYPSLLTALQKCRTQALETAALAEPQRNEG